MEVTYPDFFMGESPKNDTDAMPPMDGDMDMDAMHMTFYNHWTLHLFFDSWKFDTDSQYAGAIIGLFLVGVFVESLNLIKGLLKSKAN